MTKTKRPFGERLEQAAQHNAEELQEWTRKATRGQRDSAVFCSLWSDKMVDDPGSDPIPILQLGYAMILDKPIVIVAPHGSRIPENIKRAAKAVEFYDAGDMPSMHAATLRALTAAGIVAKH